MRKETAKISFKQWLSDNKNRIEQSIRVFNSNPENHETDSNPLISFANHYFLTSANAYLEIIKILEPFAANITSKIPELIKASTNPSVGISKKLSEQLAIIDSVRFVPHIFHPYYEESRKQYFLRSNKWCYLLASNIRDGLNELQSNVDDKLYDMIKTLAGHKLSKIVHTLNGRINRYEYNARFNHFAEEYENDIRPKLNKAYENLIGKDNISFKEYAEIRNLLKESLDKALEWPAGVPQFLRDDPNCIIGKSKYTDNYPAQVVTFFKERIKTDAYSSPSNASDKYQHEIDARNIFLAMGIEKDAAPIIELLKSNHSVHCHGDEIFENIEQQYRQLKEKNDASEKNSGSHKERVNWAKSIYELTEKLYQSFLKFSQYDVNGRHFLTPKTQLAINKICKEFYDEFGPCHQIAQGYKDIYALALVTVFTDLINEMHDLVSGSLRKLDALKDGKSCSEYKELNEFLENAKPLLKPDAAAAARSVFQSGNN